MSLLSKAYKKAGISAFRNAQFTHAEHRHFNRGQEDTRNLSPNQRIHNTARAVVKDEVNAASILGMIKDSE